MRRSAWVRVGTTAVIVVLSGLLLPHLAVPQNAPSAGPPLTPAQQALAQAPDVVPHYDRGPYTAAEFDELYKKSSNWGRWGKDDQIGALNLITPEKRRQAAAAVKYGLAISLARDEPLTGGRIKHTTAKAGGEFYTDSYQVPGHNDNMTHIDALCHMWYKGKSYNGYSLEEVASENGCMKNGLAMYKNGIVTRALLIDLPRLKGVPYLAPSTPIYSDDLEAWEKQVGVKITSGDAILLRTGRWVRDKEFPEHPNTMTQLMKVGAPGMHASVGPWLKDRGVAMVGQDGGAGVFPSPVPGVVAPFSIVAINGLGIPLIVALDLEEAVATAARLNRWELLFTVAPLQVPTGTGSPVHPVGVF